MYDLRIFDFIQPRSGGTKEEVQLYLQKRTVSDKPNPPPGKYSVRLSISAMLMNSDSSPKDDELMSFDDFSTNMFRIFRIVLLLLSLSYKGGLRFM